MPHCVGYTPFSVSTWHWSFNEPASRGEQGTHGFLLHLLTPVLLATGLSRAASSAEFGLIISVVFSVAAILDISIAGMNSSLLTLVQ
jgi:hypothetical protein